MDQGPQGKTKYPAPDEQKVGDNLELMTWERKQDSFYFGSLVSEEKSIAQALKLTMNKYAIIKHKKLLHTANDSII